MLDTDHLVDLAQTEASTRAGGGAPRQIALRRAASTAYYAVFHSLARHIAETFVAAAIWKSRVLFYRAIDHGKAKARCKKLGQSPLPQDERDFFGISAFSIELRTFANNFVALQDLRHRCDYDPEFKILKAEAQQSVSDARDAIAGIDAATADERNQFLAYILFGMRPA